MTTLNRSLRLCGPISSSRRRWGTGLAPDVSVSSFRWLTTSSKVAMCVDDPDREIRVDTEIRIAETLIFLKAFSPIDQMVYPESIGKDNSDI